jgi:hypothetical protein
MIIIFGIAAAQYAGYASTHIVKPVPLPSLSTSALFAMMATIPAQGIV